MDRQRSLGSTPLPFRYRRVGPSSSVDESLFSASSFRPSLGGRSQEVRGRSTLVTPVGSLGRIGGSIPSQGGLYITGRDAVIAIFPKDPKECRSEPAVVLSTEELHQIQRLRTFQGETQQSHGYMKGEGLHETIAKAAELKRRMQELDAARSQLDMQRTPPRTDPADPVHRRAREAQEEGLEEIRQMNSIILKSKVDAIRTLQVQRKREAAAARQRASESFDGAVEAKRLVALREAEAAEEERRKALKRQAEMLKQQIAERQAQREAALEEIEREHALMTRQLQALKEEEEKARERKAAAARLLQKQVDAHNMQQLKERKEREALEALEAEKIQQYAAERLQREREIQQKRDELKALKQKDVDTIMQKQDREIDRAAQLDALRAKRAFEEKERREREKEQKDREVRASIQRALKEARDLQRRERVARLAESAAAEQKEFRRLLGEQRRLEDLEREREESQRRARIQHLQALKAQIEAHREQKALRVLSEKEEAKKHLQEIEAQKVQIERAKLKKLEELKQIENAEKYIAQLQKIQYAC